MPIERGLVSDIVRMIGGRPRGVSEGVQGFSYSTSALRLPLVFVGLSIVEVAFVHVIVPWEWLRNVLVLATVGSLVLMVGVAAGRAVHPHLLTESVLVLRNGRFVVAELPRSDIASVTQKRMYSSVQPELNDDVLALATMQGTNVEIRLHRPLSVELNGLLSRPRRSDSILSIECFVDDPDRFVRALGETLPLR